MNDVYIKELLALRQQRPNLHLQQVSRPQRRSYPGRYRDLCLEKFSQSIDREASVGQVLVPMDVPSPGW